MVSKKEIIAELSEKYNNTIDVMSKIFDEQIKMGEGLGYSGEDLLKYARRRVTIYFKKQELKQGDLHKLVVVGIRSNSYGNQKIYDKALEVWNKDPQKAQDEGLCNEEGTPVYQSGKRKGETMKPEEFTVKTCYGVIQKIEETVQHDWKVVSFNIPQSIAVPMFCITEGYFSARGDVTYCNSDNFIIKQKLTYEQVKELAKEHYEKIKLKNAEQWSKENEGKFDKLCYSVVDLAGVTISDKNKSNTLQVCDTIESDDDVPVIFNGWVSKYPELSINIKEGSENIILFHMPNKDTTNIAGFISEERYLKSVEPEKISPGDEEPVEKSEDKKGWVEDI